jgi:hypothetical protein
MDMIPLILAQLFKLEDSKARNLCYYNRPHFGGEPMATEKKWADLTPAEKREQRYQRSTALIN